MFCIICIQFNQSISQYILWQPAPPFTTFVLQILFGSHNEERFILMYFEKSFECILSTVKYVVRTWFTMNFLHCLWVVNRCSRDMEESGTWDSKPYSTCTFTPPFFLRNFAHQKTDKHNVMVIESKIYTLPFNLKISVTHFLLAPHIESEVFKDTVVTILIG